MIFSTISCPDFEKKQEIFPPLTLYPGTGSIFLSEIREKDKKGLTIGQVAKKGVVNIETIRYYERKGLIPPPPRLESGYRQYPGDTVARVRFIKRAQELGFSLKEVSELFDLRFGPDTTCTDVRKRAEAKIKEIEGKMNTLGKMREVLERLAAECKGSGPVSECPILEALEGRESDDDER